MADQNIARMIRLGALIPSSYPEIIKLINQDVNPIAAFSAVGATTVGMIADFEASTDGRIPDQERQDASRDFGRKIRKEYNCHE